MIRTRLNAALDGLAFAAFLSSLFALVLSLGSCSEPVQPTIEVTPPTAALVSGQTVQLLVTRHYPHGPVEVVTDRVSYTSSNKAAGTVNDKGLFTAGVEAGTILVRVTDPLNADTIATATFNVTAAKVDSIEITPSPSVVLRPGVGRRLTAIAHSNNGATQDVTSSVTWESSNASVATVGQSLTVYGLVLPVAEGDAIITATDPVSLVQGKTTVFVRGSEPGLSAIVVSPNPGAIGIGAAKALPFAAQGFFTDGTSRDVTKIVTWSSSNLTIATIDANGLATGLAAGDVTITASGASGSVKGSAAAKVQ